MCDQTRTENMKIKTARLVLKHNAIKIPLCMQAEQITLNKLNTSVIQSLLTYSIGTISRENNLMHHIRDLVFKFVPQSVRPNSPAVLPKIVVEVCLRMPH